MPRERLWPSFLFLCVISLFLIFFSNIGLIKPVLGITQKVTVPLQESIYRISQGGNNIIFSLTSIKTSSKKISDLEKQLCEFSSQSVRLKNLEEENNALRKQLEAPLPPNMKMMPAKTLGLTRFLIIDKGEDDGVKIGMMVISQNVLVGKIISSTSNTSSVILPLDPDSKIPAKTLKTNAQGLVIGEFGTKAIFGSVLQAETLEKDDLIVTTGENGYNRDLLIGKIGKITKKDVEPFQSSQVEPLIDYGSLINVFVVN